jgi:hypothetical protein
MEAAVKCLSSTTSLVSKLVDVLEQRERELKRWEDMMRVLSKVYNIRLRTVHQFHQLPFTDEDKETVLLNEFGKCMAMDALKDQAPQ